MTEELHRSFDKGSIVRSIALVLSLSGAADAFAQECHPSYEEQCVPIASDVDCANGSGNGPAYVRGPVRVVGPDVYGLDRDGNGWGCENG